MIVATTSTFIADSEDIDYSVVQLPDCVDLSAYGYLQLRESGPVVNESIYVSQHPDGNAKRIVSTADGGSDSTILSVGEDGSCGTDQVGHDADTQGGSSGSPLLSTRRKPESAPFEVPQDNTTTQAMELDRQREALQQQQQDTEREAPATAVISVRLNGLWMPLEIDILSLRRALRRALRLPDHDIFSRGIYHEFTPAQPTNASMDDEDHAEEMSTD
ncbi:hypothetical protein PR001_g15402 [Phytophthora rubi]|uniref:Uncharacterized protein n=2 Tax=Phytophthora TaxID=4783 RepID=A0A6A3L665_9STRA|nr:hypothetical protein PR001_g15402 [Phytophthora rubi]